MKAAAMIRAGEDLAAIKHMNQWRAEVYSRQIDRRMCEAFERHAAAIEAIASRVSSITTTSPLFLGPPVTFVGDDR